MKKTIVLTILIVAFGSATLFIVNCGVSKTPPSTEDISNSGVVKGPNRGEHGNDDDQVFYSLTVATTTPDVLYVGTEGNGIFKSTDGRSNWQWIRNGLYYDTHNLAYPEIYSMAVAPGDENLVYAAANAARGPLWP